MPANTAPIFTVTPNVGIGGGVLGPSANTSLDGSGSNSYLVFTAGSNGSYIDEVVFKPVGSPAATVARLFYCSATGTFTPGTTNTSSNSTLIEEVGTPTVTVSQTSAAPRLSIQMNRAIPPSTKLFVTFGTSTGAAGTGYEVTVFGGDY